jgi:putative protease
MSHKRPDNRAYTAGLDANWTEESLFAANQGLVSVTAKVTVRIGEPLCITFEHKSVTASAKGSIVDPARTKALSESDIIEHVGRVGGTPFTITDWQVELDAGAGLGFSALHKVRNAALEELREAILAPWHTRKLEKSAELPVVKHRESAHPKIACLAANDAVAKAAHKAGADIVWRMGAEFLPQIMHDGETEKFATGVSKPSDDAPAIVVNNLGQIAARNSGRLISAHAKDDAYTAAGAIVNRPLNNWVAGVPLNITNNATVTALADLGATTAWLSPELTLEQIRLLASTSELPLALTIYGQQQLMVTEHCVLMTQGPCNQDCRNCPRRKAPRLLEDRKGYRLPIWTDETGRSHIHNAVTLDLIPSVPELIVAGISLFVIDATLLATKETAEQIERTKRAIKVALLNGASLKKQEGATTGHLYRAVE